MLSLLLSLIAAPASAAEGGCAPVSLSDLTADEAPAIVILGETPGEPDDLRRAVRVVKALRRKGHVTLALEAVHHTQTSALDALRSPTPDLDAVPDQVAWTEHWTWPYAGYRPLVELGLSDVVGIDLIAIGPNKAAPAGTHLSTIPSGYADRLAVLAGADMPRDMRDRVAQARTWGDAQMAERALDAWKGEGYLVILADRTRVAGPGGVDWQVRQRVNATPVVAATLDYADLDCVDGTLQWQGPWMRIAGPIGLVPR